MKSAIVFLTLVAFASARPQLLEKIGNAGAKTVEFVSDLAEDGYNFLFEQDDGQKREEIGELIKKGGEAVSLVVRGFFSFLGDDGKTYAVAYTADKNGFHPEGEHLPPAANVRRGKPLGIPPSALASLAFPSG